LIFDDVNIIALDLYDGRTATNRENASQLMQSVKEERAKEIIKGALTYAGENAEIQSVGWCFGGGWSLQCALIAGEKSKGCVIYYDMPEKDENKLKTLHAPLLGIFASNDGWINQEVVDSFEKSMNEINKPLTIKWYDADHAFANPSNPKFDNEAANDANSKARQFLQTNFAR
jgi:carboxymethylenebutenolidase